MTTQRTKNGQRSGALVMVFFMALFPALLPASGALAKTKSSGTTDTDNSETQLFNGWTRSEINQMPQDMFDDTGAMITQTDGISNDSDGMNENE